MQNGAGGNQFGPSACSSQSTRVGFSSTSETCGNASSSYHTPSSRRPWPNMPYGSEYWSSSSIPLSIVVNGGYMPAAGTQLGHARNPSPTHPDNRVGAIERAKTACSNVPSCSALEERDYIGLSESSTTSMHRSNFVAIVPVESHCSKSIVGLDCKDTELRLGLGLTSVGEGDSSQVDAMRDGTPGQRSKDETMPDCHFVEVGTLKSCITERSSLLDRKQIPESLAYAGKLSPEQCISDKIGNSCSTSEKAFGSHPAGAIGSHTFRDSCKVQWNDELYFLKQRDTALPTSATDNQTLSVQERRGNDQQLTGLNRIAKETSVGLSGQHVLHTENHFSRDEISYELCRPEASYGNGYTPPLRCSYERRFPPHDSLASTERSAINSQAAQKAWQKCLPNDGLRSSPLQSGRIAEFDPGSRACEGLPRGMFLIPVSNVLTVPAKRPFCEAIGDSRSIHASENRSETRTSTAHSGVNSSSFGPSTMDADMKPGGSQATKAHPSSGIYSRNNMIPPTARWQTGVEQSKGLFSPIVPANASLLPLVQAPPQLKTAFASGNESAKKAPAKAPAFPVKQDSVEGHSGDGGSRAPVVGWPPIRSFRKNTLASQKPLADLEQDPPASPTDATEQVRQPSTATLFVKANMDGVPIGRKVNLKSYDSYESLKSALQEMFRRFMDGPTALGVVCASKIEHKQINLSDGTEYVLTHEDKDGDWMLVGDVPWNMFVTTVKRLRIMKVSEAIGLGPKLKTQSNNRLVEGARGK